MSLIHNERIKLTATWLNTLSGAAIAAGVIAPLVATIYEFSPKQNVAPLTLLVGVLAWFFAGVGLHLAARYLLRNLKS